MAVPKSSPSACGSCGTKLSAGKFKHRDAQYCSDACSWREYYARHGERLRAANNLRRRVARLPRRPKARPCRQCGTTFTPKMDKGAFCSTRCCNRAMSVRNQARENARRRSVSATRRQRRMRPRQCVVCDVVFTPSRIKGRCCSKRCLIRDWADRHPDLTRARQLVRRAQKRRVPYEHISPRVVFERDAWTCQLCHRPTPEQLVKTRSPWRPTIDHIVPLSKGGPHLYSNVQCACLSCNLKKGARTMEQSRPF